MKIFIHLLRKHLRLPKNKWKSDATTPSPSKDLINIFLNKFNIISIIIIIIFSKYK